MVLLYRSGEVGFPGPSHRRFNNVLCSVDPIDAGIFQDIKSIDLYLYQFLIRKEIVNILSCIGSEDLDSVLVFFDAEYLLHNVPLF